MTPRDVILDLKTRMSQDIIGQEHILERLLIGYCQLKPNLDPSTHGTGNLTPGKSMDYSQVKCLFSVQFSLS